MRKSRPELGHDVPRVGRVHHHVTCVLDQQSGDRGLVRRVDLGSYESGVAHLLDEPLGATDVVVGDHHTGEEVTAGGESDD